MPARLATLALVLALAPRLATGQEFPPAGEGAKLFEGEPLRVWTFPIGAAAGLGWPAGHMHDNLLFKDAFSGLKALQLDAGVAYKGVGVSLVYRRGLAKAGKVWCPATESCTASFDSIGGAIMIHPSEMGPKQGFGRVDFRLGVGGAQDVGEVKVSSTGEVKRVTGWDIFEIVTIGSKLGDATSRLSLGVWAAFHLQSFDKYEPASLGNPVQDKNPNTPILFELGVRFGFD